MNNPAAHDEIVLTSEILNDSLKSYYATPTSRCDECMEIVPASAPRRIWFKAFGVRNLWMSEIMPGMWHTQYSPVFGMALMKFRRGCHPRRPKFRLVCKGKTLGVEIPLWFNLSLTVVWDRP